MHPKDVWNDDMYTQSIVENQQYVIRFENHHYVWNNDEESLSTATETKVKDAALDFLSDCTGWPTTLLQVVHSAPNYISVRVRSRICGGKGGFGSLLKSQSRQAGAKATTNFGACRDLQGRRLRHVNDNVAAQHFAEWQERIDSGQATEDDMVKALVKTTSGVPGWHLQLPAWADVSKKEHRTWHRQYRIWRQTKEQQAAKQRHERELRESRVQQYVDVATQTSASVQASLQSALQEGLQSKKRIKREKDPPTALLTLTGDIILAANENDIWQIQTKSNFGTLGIVLDRARLSTNSLSPPLSLHRDSIYWEVRLVTGGLCQIGWAMGNFSPASETGDGVGDDAYSFAYDGSRKICLHKSESKDYGLAWKAGDVVGCLWDRAEGNLTFSLNGISLGVAYEISGDRVVFPAASCNPDEIVELHLHSSEMVHMPSHATCIGELLALEAEVSFALGDDNHDPGADTAVAEKTDSKVPPESDEIELDSTKDRKAEIVVEALDLQKFETVKDLEALGLDRLKGALMAIGIKCGGTLQERAMRLMSLKGLDPKDFPPKLLAKKKA